MASAERITGVSCVLVSASRLVLEVQKPGKWHRDDDGRLIIGLGCIGGSLEEGEAVLTALQREAQEEIGCRLQLRSASSTTEVSPEGRAHRRHWSSEAPRPILIWSMPSSAPDTKVAVYLGRPEGSPKPCDLPAIVSMSADLMLRIGSERLSVEAVTSGGAILQQREPIPPDALLELVGTPLILHRLRSTYRGLAERVLAEADALPEN